MVFREHIMAPQEKERDSGSLGVVEATEKKDIEDAAWRHTHFNKLHYNAREEAVIGKSRTPEPTCSGVGAETMLPST